MKLTKAENRPRRIGSIALGVLMASSALLAAPVVRSADIRITVTSPTACDVTMVLAIEGGAEIDHRIETFEATRIELAAVRGARHVGEVRTIGRTQSLVLRPETASYELSYRVVQPADREHRCPIWVPSVPTDGRSRPVRLEVDLPVAATPGASMPGFTWTGAHGTATLGHIPAIARIPYSSPGESRGWGINAMMDALAIAVFAVASAIWTWRARR